MIVADIRAGAYYDSVVLMELQRRLAALPRIDDVGVVMGTEANKELLAQSGLLAAEATRAQADDLLIVVRGDDAGSVQAALDAVDGLLIRRRGDETDVEYRPKTLQTATSMLPDAAWVLISTPGRYAASVARDALRLERNVFLYSDNVSLEDEVELKRTAAEHRLLVMGPDCGTAIVNGVGLGFANRVRRGSIGIVGASGTGLQHVTARIHQLGGGITHALGTGGRDLSAQVDATCARQALDLLSRDPETEVIVLISKPPSPTVAYALVSAARAVGKPVVIDFIGHDDNRNSTNTDAGNLHFAETLDGTAALAVQLAAMPGDPLSSVQPPPFAPGQRYLRGLFSGGTLAYEAMLLLREFLPAVYSNAPLQKQFQLAHSTESREHTIVDLGEDEFTVGRLHPMMDNELRIRRMLQEASDPTTALLLLDVVLGDGAHPDPASELAPAIQEARHIAQAGARHLEVVALVVGTDEDPQGMKEQIRQLEAAGARVELNNEHAIRRVGALLQQLGHAADLPPVDLDVLHAPFAAINVGLESFSESLTSQEASVVHVEWRPPAGGNERLAGILERMKE